jgi:cellulose biosynthesis protein BcsQ
VVVVSVVSQKGGAGKTTVVLGLAAAAQVTGCRVLVVDLDPQANASVVLDAARTGWTTHHVLADPRPELLRQAVQATGWGEGVDVVPAELALERRESPGHAGEQRLAGALDGLQGYDLVLVDCPPALGTLTRNGLAAARYALVVTEPTVFGLMGAQQALVAVDTVRAAVNATLRPAGIVLNKLRHTVEHDYRQHEVTEAYPDLVWVPPLPDRAVVAQAQGAHVPLTRWQSAAARELSRTFLDYLERLLPARRCAVARAGKDA